MEVLDLKLYGNGLDEVKGWQLLQVPNLEAKYFPAMTAISASEFVLIGGQNACVQNEVVVYDFVKNQAKIHSEEDDFCDFEEDPFEETLMYWCES